MNSPQAVKQVQPQTPKPSTPKPPKRKLWYKLILLFLAFGVILGGAGGATIFMIWRELPDVEILRDVHLQQPLRIYTRDGALIGEYGQKFRKPTDLNEVPAHVIDAFLASEDARFLEHSGIDFIGLARAAWVSLLNWRLKQGASTITMQVARNYFLDRRKNLMRKFRELLLALKIERELNKQQILELYLNRIFFGNRAYGIEAAAQVYYAKSANEISLAEAAMIAGLPQRPSVDNPIRNPEVSLSRRNNYVLPRMLELGMISQAQFEEAINTPETATLNASAVDLSAHHFAEMVRIGLRERYDDLFFEAGYRVYTTLDSQYQDFAVAAVRDELQTYQLRRSYEGVVGHIDDYFPDSKVEIDSTKIIAKLGELAKQKPLPENLFYVIVAEVEDSMRVIDGDGEIYTIALEDLKPILKVLRRRAEDINKLFRPGTLAMAYIDKQGTIRLGQIPNAQAALYSIDPITGAVRAMIGGYNFRDNKFDHAISAKRQVGSLFKPFLYSAALARSYNLSTIINDTNITFDDAGLEDEWRPSNYAEKVYGPTLLRNALVRSRNLVSIKILEDLGIAMVRDWMTRYGFKGEEQIPENLTMALGSGIYSPKKISTGLAVIANGGYLIEPWHIERIENPQGEVIYRQDFQVACLECDYTWLDSPDIKIIDPDVVKAQEANAEAGISEVPESFEVKASVLDVAHTKEERLMQIDRDDNRPNVAQYHTVRPAPQTLDPRIAFLVSSMMNDVVIRGTAAKAYRTLRRLDIYGKTGTTNDFRDSWFSGFHPKMLTTVWVGNNLNTSLGAGEVGGRIALPIWINYMRDILPRLPIRPLQVVEGVQQRRINEQTGEIVSSEDPHSRLEYFLEENIPQLIHSPNGNQSEKKQQKKVLNELF